MCEPSRKTGMRRCFWHIILHHLHLVQFKEISMGEASPHEVTRLLVAWGNGDPTALEKLTPLVHEELRRLARRYMREEKPGHTLPTAALVNEAYLRLVDAANVHWQNRAHFYAISARLMRRILVAYARRRRFLKRGGAMRRVSIDQALDVSHERG